MINQAININGLESHLLCPMQCHLNGMYISEVPKFLVESPSEMAHAIELTKPFSTANPLIISLQLSGVTSYIDIYSLNIAEYKDEDITKIHLTVEEPPTCMLDHRGWISIHPTDQYMSAQSSCYG